MIKDQAGNCVTPVPAMGTLSVQKVVVGGTAATSSFKFQVNDGDEISFEEDGENELTVEAGKTYTVTEVLPGGNYTPSYSCENLAVTEDETTTCTITNTYRVPDDKPKTCSVELVSDTSDFVIEKSDNAKALTFIHSAWTAVIAGATWIWGDNPIVNTLVDETQTFKKQFGFVGNVTNATLYVASDNKHSAVLNSGSVHADLAENNFSDANKNTYDVTSDVNQGNNELLVSVTNIGLPSTNAASNPAGLLYKLVIEGTVTTDDDCLVPYEPPYQPDNATFDGYKWNDEDGDGVWDESENGIAGWVLQAIDSEDTVVATTSTDINGHYIFTLDTKKGPWTIEEVNQINWEQTAVLKHDDGTYKVEYCQWSTNQYESSVYDSAYSCDFGNHYVGSNSESELSCSITASNSQIRHGDDVTLNWSSVDAMSASIDNGIGEQATSGSYTVKNLEDNTTFMMTVYGEYVGDSEVRESKTCSVLVNTLSGGGHGGKRHPKPEVLGEATSTPEVLGSQVTAVPFGAPDAGNGGTSHSATVTISQLLLTPRRLRLVK